MTDDADHAADAAGRGVQRLDKWLWYARVIRTRTLAAGLVTDGKVRVNRDRIVKPSHSVRQGDVITIAVGARVRILEVVAPGERRGPPVEAQTLYLDLSPPHEPKAGLDGSRGPSAQREQGSGRPTKRDRRATDRLRQDES